jgi:hypothetical protein
VGAGVETSIANFTHLVITQLGLKRGNFPAKDKNIKIALSKALNYP